MQYRQRLANGQPAGGSMGWGTSPCSTIRLDLSARSGSAIGTADISAFTNLMDQVQKGMPNVYYDGAAFEAADEHFARIGESDDARGQTIALGVRDDFRLAAFHDGHD